jgi:branched-chain amino acid transport system ATP-binding protein
VNAGVTQQNAPSSPASEPAGGPLLSVEGLNRAFGGVHAVRDCSFTVEPGSITGLIGPNGAGKTTAFNLIGGVLKPSGGRVLFQGNDITGHAPHRISRAGIGRTFQITRELAELSVLQNVIVHAPARGLRTLMRRALPHHELDRARELLAFVGLERLAHEPAGTLSYGQRKLLELAGVLMAGPRLVMLDEPAGGVNPRLLENIVERIRELNREGVTFLIVEHNMDVVMSLSHSVVVMAHGEVLRQASPKEVQADDRVLDAYLGKA